MKKDTVVELKKPEVVTEDPLTEICRKGAREMLTRALEDEVERFLEQFDQVRDSSGKRMVTRNGYLPERNKLELATSRLKHQEWQIDGRVEQKCGSLRAYFRHI